LESEISSMMPFAVVDHQVPPADLRRTFFDATTRFLDQVTLGEERFGAVCLADATWNGANLAGIDWEGVEMLVVNWVKA
jgi:hypothetical protein